ncbi:FAD-dependent oxidoreductase [Usitatibacter palustris]|uniref:NADH dehydrogenase-like protein YjlD n=1 Tax=Usitatibacter palustris TaxID=2732487 RepID=A0A6M4HD39_9PROT|nr:FAD-dependent oxidoreductase [Usitatibacter palustris]QJR16638.1 NADH dehydrogenase-like protein YjlD [Usitatibacter palustris]
MKRLVLLGGGHAHLHVLKDLGERADQSLSVTLVTPRPQLPYTGMLPGCIAGHYRFDEIAIDLVKLAARAHASFVQSNAVLVNPSMREVICADGSVLAYDVLSVNIGSVPRIGSAHGVEQFAIAVRPLEQAVEGWQRVLEAAHAGTVTSISIVGGGAGGVELALAMDWRLKCELGPTGPHVRVFTDTPIVMPGFPEGARRDLLRRCAARGIGVHAASEVIDVREKSVQLANKMEFASDATFWAGGAGAPDLFRDSGFEIDRQGFLSIDEYLQSVSHPGVFAAGDCATRVDDPRPKAGVFAVRAGNVLSQNIRAALAGAPLQRWKAQRRYLSLISTGDRNAVGAWGPFSFSGEWAWRWKDRIDRRFVDSFQLSS